MQGTKCCDDHEQGDKNKAHGHQCKMRPGVFFRGPGRGGTFHLETLRLRADRRAVLVFLLDARHNKTGSFEGDPYIFLLHMYRGVKWMKININHFAVACHFLGICSRGESFHVNRRCARSVTVPPHLRPRRVSSRLSNSAVAAGLLGCRLASSCWAPV